MNVTDFVLVVAVLLFAAHYADKHSNEIAKMLGCNPQAVRTIFREMGKGAAA